MTICKPQDWNLGIGIGIGIGTDIINVIISTSIRSMAYGKLSGAVTHDKGTTPTMSRDHETNKKRYISTFTWPMDHKLSRVVTWDDGTPPTKSHNTSITWSRDKQKNVLSPLSRSLCTPNLAGW